MKTGDGGTKLDPVEFLRRALAISPEDAAKAMQHEDKPGHQDEK